MDNHKKSNPLGGESHGSHLCNKCGWNFPNPHPSAKHRRAHKRVCGKIDDVHGCKVIDHDLGELSQLTGVSDDDRVLCEDPLTPSPKPEKRLEDHVLDGSVLEFSESGLKPPGKSEQLECGVEEALAVVDNATKEQVKVVDTAEDCIEKPNIEKKGCLEDNNFDVLETQENHLGGTEDAASEEIGSVATPSLEKTSVELLDFDVAPSYLVEGDAKEAKVEDLNLGCMEVQDFCTKVEAHHEEEDNRPVDESVHVFKTSVEIIDFNVAPSKLVDRDIKVEDLNPGSMEVQDFCTKIESHQEEEDNRPVDESIHVSKTNVEIIDFNAAPSKFVETDAKEANAEDLNPGFMEVQDFCIKVDSHQEEADNSPVDDSVHVSKTSVDFNVAPPKLVERDAKVEDLNLGSMEDQDFCTKIESHQEEEDNVPVDEPVHVSHSKESMDELSTRNNTEVNLEEDAKDHETIEFEKSPQILSSLKDSTLLTGKGENSRGLKMDDEAIEILPLQVNNDDAEFSSTADAILTDSHIVKEGSNLNETLINELGNTTASEEIAFADSTSVIGNTMAEVHPKEDQIEIPPPVDILTVIKTKVSSDPPCLEEEQEDRNDHLSAHKLYEAAAGTSYFEVAPPLENNNTADNLKMLISESNSMNQIEKVVDKKDGDMTGIKSMNLVPKPSRDDETEMISQIPSQTVVDKHLSEDSISNSHGSSVVIGVSSVMNESLNSEERPNNHLLSKQQFDGSSSPGEDSVEGIWGSVSVLSTQSDAQQYLNPVEPSQPDTDKSDDAFEPPSFLTLVEDPLPQKGKEQQIVQKTQQPPMSELVLQAAFPSITNTNITKETPARKKNEEIISKVANWSMPKQHTPLKSLLLSETKLNPSSSPANWKKQPEAAGNKKEEENSSLMKTSTDIDPVNPSGKGWNSPERKAKKEKRKVKGRPNWIQCVCCSSVH